MGFLDKLLGRGKDAAESAGDTAQDLGDEAHVSSDDDLSETGQAEQGPDDIRDQALRDEGRMP